MKDFISGLPDRKPKTPETIEEVADKHQIGIKRETIRRRLRVPHAMHASDEVRKATNRMLGEREEEKG